MLCQRLGYVLILLLAAIDLRAQITGAPELPGEMPAPTLETKVSRADWLITGLRISNDFDDNALDDNRNKRSNFVTVIEPHLGWNLSHSRLEWIFDYSPGFAMSHPLQTYDSRSHSLNTALRLRLTKRLTLRLRNNFLKSKNPFDRLRDSELTPGSGILDRPNGSILSPTARRTSEQAGADLTYALDPHTTIGVNGSFFSVKYGSPAGTQLPGQRLENTTSMNGHAFYSHHLTRNTWVGFEYNVQKMSFRNSQSQALVQSAFYTHTVSLTRNITVSFFAGPEHSVIHHELPFLLRTPVSESTSQSNWHWAGGATYSWSCEHTSLAASLYRKISDGGGVLGAARLSGAEIELRHQIAQPWSVDLRASYDDNKSLTGTSGSLVYLSATGGLTHNLNHDVSLEFRYWRVHLASNGVLVGNYLADHNRVSISLAYDLKHPLGK